MTSTFYRHTQAGTSILLMLLVAALIAIILIIPILRRVPFDWLLLVGPLVVMAMLVAAAWYFSSMTVEVSDRELRWSFGAGRPYSILRSEIASASVVRHPLWHGYGIRWLGPKRWAYIVSGRDAVEVRLKGGGWRRIGTDDAQGLLAALGQRKG